MLMFKEKQKKSGNQTKIDFGAEEKEAARKKEGFLQCLVGTELYLLLYDTYFSARDLEIHLLSLC